MKTWVIVTIVVVVILLLLIGYGIYYAATYMSDEDVEIERQRLIALFSQGQTGGHNQGDDADPSQKYRDEVARRTAQRAADKAARTA
jgi:hypothetical protein